MVLGSPPPLLLHWKASVFVAGSEEGAEEAKQALLKAVGKVTDVVSSLGFSWWQGGPPHTQSLKDLHWVGARSLRLQPFLGMSHIFHC